MKSLLGVVLIGLAIFGYTEACRAECAWVLWMKSELTTFEKDKVYPNQIVTWELIGAVPKFEQCLEMQKELFERQKNLYTKKDFAGVAEVDAKPYGLIWITFKSGGWHAKYFSCLPDTIDPRK